MIKNKENQCPKCKKYTYRKQVSVYVDMPGNAVNATKKHLNQKDYKILGVNWDKAMDYCENPKCRFSLALKK